MKICWIGFAAKSHSWSHCAQNISRALIQQGHQVDLFSTNGIQFFPEDLKPNLIGYSEEKQTHLVGRFPDDNYDMCLTYTAMKNFQPFLSHSKTNRFGLWVWEFAGHNALPTGFAKHHQFCDQLLPPSQFGKQVFLDSGVPSSKMTVIPHGIEAKFLDPARGKYQLKTKKSIKLLTVIGQPHIRKNIGGLLDAYGKAFTKKDDVCLVLKVVDKKPEAPFEQHFSQLYRNFQDKYPNHAEVEVIAQFIQELDPLYRACDIYYHTPHSEGFGIPFLEALATKLVVIAPNWGGQIDFLHNGNSLLVGGKVVPAPPQALYWQAKPGTHYFQPDLDETVEKLRYAVNHLSTLKERFQQQHFQLVQDYSWANVAKRILELAR